MPTNRGPRRRPPLRLVLAVLVALALLALVAASWHWADLIEAHRDAYLVRFEATMRGLGPWGIAASLGLMVLHSFLPFPAELIAMANGMVYGVLWGSIITWSGAMLGAWLAFGLARALGRPWVERMLRRGERRAFELWSEPRAAQAVLVARLLPFVAFNLVNYAAGVTRMRVWTFTWTTGLGILPLTLAMVVIGERAEAIPWYGWVGVAALAVALWWLGRRLRTHLRAAHSSAGPAHR